MLFELCSSVFDQFDFSGVLWKSLITPDWTNPIWEKSPHQLNGTGVQIRRCPEDIRIRGVLRDIRLLGAKSRMVGRVKKELHENEYADLFVLRAIMSNVSGIVDAIGHLMIIAILFVIGRPRSIRMPGNCWMEEWGTSP